MSDKSYTPADGTNYEVVKTGSQKFQVGKTELEAKTEITSVDHQTSRVHWTRGNRRDVFWVYSVRNKKYLSWPGGSIEIDAQDLSEGSAAAGGAAKPLKLTMPGKVLDVKVKEGEIVEGGQALVVVEAMKMENLLLAPARARVAKVHVKTGDRLESGTVLISFAAADE